MEQEHRGAPRFPFIAAAEVLAENNGSRMSARISDLSVSGCYVDTINPLSDGTLVQVKIITETQILEALRESSIPIPTLAWDWLSAKYFPTLQLCCRTGFPPRSRPFALVALLVL